MKRERPIPFELEDSALLSREEARVLDAAEERALLVELCACRRQLLEGCVRLQLVASDGELLELDVQELIRGLVDLPAEADAEVERLLGLASRHQWIRNKLAMANLRLVAHVVKRYRNRGLAASDLLQEGFCGLMKAIDRFDCQKETRLASYAVWWIRQALQRAVAAGAYPVRLNPRHLQQLAHSAMIQGDQAATAVGGSERSVGALETIVRIQAATRATVSLNAGIDGQIRGSLLEALTDSPQDETRPAELDEDLFVMLNRLRPREQAVLRLRYGLAGEACHSLSQVSQILAVSKERIRQIQEAAIRKLRRLSEARAYCCAGRS